MTTVVERLAGLVDIDPARCTSAEELAALVHVVQGVRGWLDAFEARCATRVAALAATGVSSPPAELLADGGRRRWRDATVAASRAEVCAAMPAFAEALAGGAVSSGHVDAVARAVDGLSSTARAELIDVGPSLVS